MSEKEKEIMNKLKNAIPEMSDFQKGYILGMAETLKPEKDDEKVKDNERNLDQVIQLMKNPKKLTRAQKECLSAHYLNAKEWMLVEETEFYLKIIKKSDGKIKRVDKSRRVSR